MSPPPGVPGYPGATELPPPVGNVHRTIHDLSGRVAGVEERTARIEGHTAEMVGKVTKIEEATNRFAGYEAIIKHLVAKGTLLILGAVGSTYGFTRATQPPPTHERVEVIKSATTVKVEACTAMQPGPDRDRCALKILADLMSPAAR